MQVLKVSAILIPQITPNPLVRKGFEGLIDTVTYTQLLRQYSSTENPQLILCPQGKTWKDAAYKGFRIAATSFYLINSVFSIANVAGYLDEKDTSFIVVNNATAGALALSAIHFVLLKLHLISCRE